MPSRRTALLRPRLLAVGVLLLAGQVFLVPSAVGDGDVVVTPTVSPGTEPDGTLPEGEVADLETEKHDKPARVTEGNDVAYTVIVVNNGPDTATGIELQDTLAEGTTLISIEEREFTCPTVEPTSIECTLESLAVGESASIQLVVTTPSDVGEDGEIIQDTALVDADEADPVPENNEVVENTSVLEASETLSVGFIAPGEPARITTDVEPPGPDVGDPTVIGMRFPEGPGGEARIREVKCAPPFAPCIDIVGKVLPAKGYERVIVLIRHDPSVVDPGVPNRQRKVLFKKPGLGIRELVRCRIDPSIPCVQSVRRNAEDVLVFKVLISSDPRLGTR
jgi:uncharacterized repeat protein (TIGR01451 family)